MFTLYGISYLFTPFHNPVRTSINRLFCTLMLSMILKLCNIKHEFDQIDYSLIMEKNHLKKKI